MSSRATSPAGTVADRRLRILQVSTADVAGGAEKVAWNLFQSYRACGHLSSLAVGFKRTGDPDVLLIPNSTQRHIWSRFFWRVHNRLRSQGKRTAMAQQAAALSRWLAAPRATMAEYCGIEDFHFPGTSHLLDLMAQPPDIVHCHNLHGGYFDLRAIARLSRQVPVVLTLHDAWLLSGHCAHSFDCERWRSGCGHCPDLSIYPAVHRDATAYNWRRKQRIYATSQLHVAVPSQWLMRKVEQSILVPAIREARVVHNGVDLSIFHPAEQDVVRSILKIPPAARVILFAANGIRRNTWKDYETMRAAIAQVAAHLHGESVLFFALGEDARAERIGTADVRFVPYQDDARTVAQYYQAADVYLHAAKADTFPNTVIEALACGVPVVATAVGGIPEQVKGLQGFAGSMAGQNRHGVDHATGVLVLPGNPKDMACAVEALLINKGLRARIGRNAAEDARERFDLKRQADEYLKWYEQLRLLLLLLLLPASLEIAPARFQDASITTNSQMSGIMQSSPKTTSKKAPQCSASSQS